MTDDARVFSTLHDVTGLPGTKLAWPLGEAPSLPWFVYSRERKGELYADNGKYFTMPRYRVELYTSENEPELLESFERAVELLGSDRFQETWIEGENCLIYSFTFTLTKEGA